MSNYLPTERTNLRHYVYLHIDPDIEVNYGNSLITNEVVYVGMGTGPRAWTFGNHKTEGAYGHRSKEHWDWYLGKEYEYSVEDLVLIYSNRMTKPEALAHEKEVILEFSPKFNQIGGAGNLKVTPEDYRICLELRKSGMFYHEIAKEVNLSTMTVHRALNGKTKNIGEDFAK